MARDKRSYRAARRNALRLAGKLHPPRHISGSIQNALRSYYAERRMGILRKRVGQSPFIAHRTGISFAPSLLAMWRRLAKATVRNKARAKAGRYVW